MSTDQAAEISRRYTRFADDEVRGRSSLYELLARGVAGDSKVIEFLTTVPPAKRQPNLLLAAVRYLFGAPTGWADFREALLSDTEAVRSLMLTHSTQTNEPGRCATLLPVLALLPPPLALIEVGASAGLCLLPDHYGYDYGTQSIRPENSESQYPVFPCSASRSTPLPTVMPKVIWRAGLDLNPLDVSDESQRTWLENLVWPEQTERLDRLQAAMKVAAATKLRLVNGSLLGHELERLCREAPTDATLVVFHTAVLAYVSDRADREDFAERVRSLAPFWVSNESPRVFPDIVTTGNGAGRFLLAVNGFAVAWTDPHGASIEWISDGVLRNGRNG